MANPLKSVARRLVDWLVVPGVRYISRQIDSSNVLRELERRTAVECADYAQANMATALQFETRRELLAFSFGKAAAPGLVAEFGVWTGGSINQLASLAKPKAVYGFDSFEGLREDWKGWKETKGHFSLEGRLPAVEQNVVLVKGWFHETLPGFLSEHPEPASFLHIDSDTYESAGTILDLIGSRIRPGTVIVFDEYFGYRGWKLGEYKAWQQFAADRRVAYEYVGFSTQSVSVRVVALEGQTPS
jgi:hypothetical protein